MSNLTHLQLLGSDRPDDWRWLLSSLGSLPPSTTPDTVVITTSIVREKFKDALKTWAKIDSVFVQSRGQGLKHLQLDLTQYIQEGDIASTQEDIIQVMPFASSRGILSVDIKIIEIVELEESDDDTAYSLFD
jgi:hypothetical protein